MSKWIVAALLCGIAGGAPAQTETQLGEVRISVPRIVLPPQLRNMYLDQFDEVKGEYDMSNGQRMALSMWGNRMYARIGNQPRVQLVAVGPYEFVARNQSMRLDIDTTVPGETTAVILMVTDRLASGPMIEATRLTASR